MGKLVVTNSIMIQDKDINEWAEPAKANETRSYVNFDSTNKYLTIEKSSYNKKYVKALNIKSEVLFPHIKKLGRLGGEDIWLTEKGCNPVISPRSRIITVEGQPNLMEQYESYNFGNQTYILEHMSGNKTKITPKILFENEADDLSSSPDYSIINTACFFIKLVGGGSSGSCGWFEDRWFWQGNLSGDGKGGKAAGGRFMYVDMTKALKVTLFLGVGGSGYSRGKDTLYPGTNSYIQVGDKMLIAPGGYDKKSSEADHTSSVVDMSFFDSMGVVTLYYKDVSSSKLSALGKKISCDFASGSHEIATKWGGPGSVGDAGRGEPSMFSDGGKAGLGNNIGEHGRFGSAGGGGKPGDGGNAGDDSHKNQGGDGGNGAFQLFY